jgi:hypothetical protein
MGSSVLALFDPIYDQLSREILSSAPTSGRNTVVDSPPTQSAQGDASIASHQAQQARITTSLESPPSNQPEASAPSQSARIMNARPGTHGHGAMYSSQVPPARSKPKPFGSRRLPVAAIAPRQLDRNIALGTSVLTYQHHLSTARSVSLPTKPTSHDRFNHTVDRSRVAMLGAVHTNRVVSLPEVAALTSRLSGAPHLHFSTLPTVDELQPLIDLNTPPRRTLVTPQAAASSTALLVQSSFPNPLQDDPSPPSSPELSETDILVGSPATGRSVNFLRYDLAPSTRTTDSLDPPPATPWTTKPTTAENESQGIETPNLHHNDINVTFELANSTTHIEPPTAKPIPALHGPPSLPYARCPS